MKQKNNLSNAFKGKQILVVGDAMVDSYIHGSVDRISPEAPVPVLLEKFREYRAGGAANVAMNLHHLGAIPVLFTYTGKDRESEILKNIFIANGLYTDGIFQDENYKTTIKTRLMSGNHQLLRIDSEKELKFSNKNELFFIKQLQTILNKYHFDALVIEDYNKGLLTPNLIKTIIKESNQRNIPVVVDPKKENIQSFKNVYLFKPNLKEFNLATQKNFQNTDVKNIGEEAILFTKKMKINAVMITLASNGVLIADKKSYKHYPAHIRNIYDVSGAGDTVVSLAALCIAAKIPLNKAAQIANISGGLVCEQSGVVPVNLAKLQEECNKLIK